MNPLVALYFATEDVNDYEVRTSEVSTIGEVLAFKIPWEAVKYSDSDAVSCLANLAYMTHEERRKLRELGKLERDPYNAHPVVARLHQFVRAEKPGFSPQLDPLEIRNTYFVNPRDSNSRMIAQAGKFLIYGERVGYEHIESDFSVVRFTIPSSYKIAIRKELDRLSINGRTLFPEVESATKYIKARFV
jgi:hypothetical protein